MCSTCNSTSIHWLSRCKPRTDPHRVRHAHVHLAADSARIIVDDAADEQPTSLDTMTATPDDGGDRIAPADATSAAENLCTGMSTLAVSYNVLVHVLLYGYTIYLSWISFVNPDRYSIFCWHSPLSLLGVSYHANIFHVFHVLNLWPFCVRQYSILMTESMLCFSNHNLFTHRLSHRSRVYVHWILQVGAAICIVAGLMAAVIHKLHNGHTHFRSNHALVGIVAIGLTALTMLHGLPTKYAYRLRGLVRPVLLKVSHSVLALVAYVVAVAATLLALYSSTYVQYTGNSESVFYALCVMIVFSGQYVVYGPVVNVLGRLGKARRCGGGHGGRQRM